MCVCVYVFKLTHFFDISFNLVYREREKVSKRGRGRECVMIIIIIVSVPNPTPPSAPPTGHQGRETGQRKRSTNIQGISWETQGPSDS